MQMNKNGDRKEGKNSSNLLAEVCRYSIWVVFMQRERIRDIEMTNIAYLRDIKKRKPGMLDTIIDRHINQLCQDCPCQFQNRITISDTCETCLKEWLDKDYGA